MSGGKKTSAITRLVSSHSSEIISADGICRTITRYTIARQTKTLLPANNPERDRCKRLDRSYDVRTKRTANRENRGLHGITNIEGIARAPSVSVCIAWSRVAIRRACARMQPRIAFFIRNVRAREREQVYGTVEYWTKVKFILHYFSVRGEPMYYRNTSSSVACVRASMISVCILIAMM